MPNWDLEIAAEDLRRYAPDGWAKFMQALDVEARATLSHLLDAPNTETLLQFQGEARAWRSLLNKLNSAPDTAQKLKAKENG